MFQGRRSVFISTTGRQRRRWHSYDKGPIIGENSREERSYREIKVSTLANEEKTKNIEVENAKTLKINFCKLVGNEPLRLAQKYLQRHESKVSKSLMYKEAIARVSFNVIWHWLKNLIMIWMNFLRGGKNSNDGL